MYMYPLISIFVHCQVVVSYTSPSVLILEYSVMSSRYSCEHLFHSCSDETITSGQWSSSEEDDDDDDDDDSESVTESDDDDDDEQQSRDRKVNAAKPMPSPRRQPGATTPTKTTTTTSRRVTTTVEESESDDDWNDEIRCVLLSPSRYSVVCLHDKRINSL